MSTPHAATFRGRRPHVNPWLAAVIGLAAALIGLSAWVIVDRTTTSKAVSSVAPTTGLASAPIGAMLEARLAALNSGGTRPLARFYSHNATQEEFDVVPPAVTTGGANIAARNEGFSRLWAMADLRVTRVGPVIQLGNYAAHAIRMGNWEDAIVVFRLDQSGKIDHQWVIGG